jgi:hypothetical protein
MGSMGSIRSKGWGFSSGDVGVFNNYQSEIGLMGLGGLRSFRSSRGWNKFHKVTSSCQKTLCL